MTFWRASTSQLFQAAKMIMNLVAPPDTSADLSFDLFAPEELSESSLGFEAAE